MAVVTLVGLFPTVCPLVSLHVILLNEPHATFLTAKWLLTSMDFLMPLEKVFLNKAHITLAALKGLLAGVNEYVSLKVVVGSEGSIAVVAHMTLWALKA